MRYVWLMLALVMAGTTACDRSRDELNAALAEAKQVSAEKDSLLNEVLETTKFVSDLNTELAKIKSVGVSPVPASEQTASGAAQERTAALGRIKETITRLNEAEQKLAQQTQRASRMGRRNERLLAQLESAKQTVADLKAAAERQEAEYTAVIDRQKVEIAALTSRVDTMTLVNEQLNATQRRADRYRRAADRLQEHRVLRRGHQEGADGARASSPRKGRSSCSSAAPTSSRPGISIPRRSPAWTRPAI